MDYSLLQSLPLFQSMDTDRIRRIILLSGCFEKDYKKEITFTLNRNSSRTWALSSKATYT